MLSGTAHLSRREHLAVKLRIDTDRCTGHGRCYDLAPDLFTDDEQGHGEVVVAEPGEAQLAAARLAVNSCPERAVILEDD
jgi:ferredoxin